MSEKKETTFELLNKYFELSIEHQDYVEENDPDMKESIDEIGKEIDLIESQITQKIENIKHVQNVFKGYKESITAKQFVYKQEIDRLGKKKNALDNSWNRIEQIAIGAVKTIGTPNKKGQPVVKSEFGTFFIRKTESVNFVEGKEVPEQFLSDPKPLPPSKTKIKKALKNGEDLDFAYFVEKETLGIR